LASIPEVKPYTGYLKFRLIPNGIVKERNIKILMTNLSIT